MSLINQSTDFFKLALKNNYQNGDLEHKQNYYLIVNELSNSKSWQTLFKQLSFCVTYIDKCYTDLLTAVWNLNVKEASTAALENFLEFLINLNSAHGGLYLENTYTLFLRAFREGLDEGVDINEVLDGSKLLSNNVQAFTKFHAAIKKLLWTIPTSAPVLSQAIRKEMPFSNAHLIHQTRYVSNILTIMDYCPALRESIFNCIVDLIIQIDVEIQVEEEDEEESNEEEMLSIFNMDEKKAILKKNTQQQLKNENSLNLARVDFLMIIVMEWFNSKDEEEKEEMFQYMLTSFDRSIVTTHKSKYTQFLIFYMCKQGTTYVDRFLNYLTQRYLNYTLSSQMRQAAASYLGSFVCRAKYLSQNIVRKTVGYLTSWLHCYIDLKGNDEPDVDKHGIFYSLCQALFFIFCFKKTHLIGQDDKFVHNLALDRIVKCNLNPLKFLIKDVVKEFSSICDEIKLMNCKPITKANKKLPKQKNLETFFPFDPINLIQTSLLINPIYQEWDDNDDEEETEGHNAGLPIPNSIEYMNEGESLSESFEDNMSFGNSFNNSLEMSYT